MGYHFENKIPVITAISRAISWFYQGSNFSDISCCSVNFFFLQIIRPRIEEESGLGYLLLREKRNTSQEQNKLSLFYPTATDLFLFTSIQRLQRQSFITYSEKSNAYSSACVCFMLQRKIYPASRVFFPTWLLA